MIQSALWLASSSSNLTYYMDGSSESSGGGICNNCAALNLSIDKFTVKVNDVEDDKPIELGNLSDIQQRSDECRLCCFVALTVQKSTAPQSAPVSRLDGLDLNWNIRWRKCGHHGPHKESMPHARCLEVYPSALGNNTGDEFDSLRLYLLGDNAPSPMFYGRRIQPDQIDISMVKYWRQSCEEWHGASCEEPILKGLSTPWGIPDIRVIDVQQQCLVKMPHGCRYVTLSYVWGSEPTFTATKENIKYLEVVGSLQTWISEFPTTIRDAIDLVSRLGERYLWVDKVCIVQDNLSSKQAQIWNMDRIYGHATLSITAGSGENADAGLPGVRLQSRNKVQSLAEVKPGITLMNVCFMKTLYGQAAYEQRTWTYQERFLSKRLLVFLAGQVFFHCRKASWSEDIVAEDPHVDSYELILGSDPSTRLDHNPLISYANSIRDFTARNITYDWDILNAFAGISNYWAEKLDATMKYGLPNSLFDWVILWESRQPLTRRRTDRQEFPSWSWAGWNGPVDIPTDPESTPEALQKWLATHTWILWNQYSPNLVSYVWDVWGMSQRHVNERPKCTIGYRMSNSIDPFGRLKKRLPLSNKDTRSDPSLLEQIPFPQEPSFQSRARSLAGQLLFFYTISATYNVSAPKTGLLPQYGGRAQPILDRRGVLSGYVIFDQGPRNLKGHEAFELIAISDSKSCEWTEERYNEAIERAQNIDKSAYNNEQPFFDLDPGPDSEDIRNWNLYNVLFIHSRENIAERIGIGKLYKKAIAHSLAPGPLWKPVFLA